MPFSLTRGAEAIFAFSHVSRPSGTPPGTVPSALTHPPPGGMVAPILEARMSLENKVAIVTGGAKGIGLAVARRFAREARVVIADIDEDAGSRAVEEIGESGPVRFVRC